jgi:type II secretory pathway component PulM
MSLSIWRSIAEHDRVQSIRTAIDGLWTGLSAKDQRALSVLALLAIPAVLVWGLWLPAQHAHTLALAERNDQLELVEWLRVEAPALQGLAGVKMSAEDLPQQAQTIAQTQGLSVARIETDASGVRVTLTNTRLTSVATFMQTCRSKGIRIVDAQISREGSTNQVKVLLSV